MTLTETDIVTDLLSLKDAALIATKNRDAAFYDSYLDDSAIAVVPFGVFDKKGVIEAMTRTDSPLRSLGISDVKAMAVNPDVGIVTYLAKFESDDGSNRDMFVITVYVKRRAGWKGFFYQQTPVLDTQG